MRYESLSDMPEGLRKLAEKQLAKQAGKPTPQDKAAENSLSELLESKKKSKRKYNNLPTERLAPNGECIKFRSKKEACYYDRLMMLEKQGLVRKIRLEVEYLLKAGYTDPHSGERIRGIRYIADFVFEQKTESGQWQERIIDTKGGGKKGTETKTFVIKRKLMAELGYNVEVENG